MYRVELNGYFPRGLIQKEYRKHLPTRLTVRNEVYTSNQDVEDLLNNVALMKSIRNEISEADEELHILRQEALSDEEVISRPFRRPSKERDYE